MIPPTIMTILSTILPNDYHAFMAKIGIWINSFGLATVGANAVMIANDEILGATPDEWKVYGVIIGSICGIAGLIMQFVFKVLEWRHRKRMSLMNRRKSDKK